MSVPAPLRIALITRGTLKSDYDSLSDDGWAFVRFGTGNAAPENLDSLDDVMETLIAES
jgi:hypothetical protein